MIDNEKNKAENEKTATDNQWVTTGKNLSDNRERRDGSGKEDASKK